MKKKEIYCRLQELMDAKGVNQWQLSQELGIARTTISRLFHNNCERIDLDILSSLCKYFDCNVGDLLEFKNTGDQP